MVASRRERRSVRKRDSEGRLQHLPVIENTGSDVAAAPATTFGADDHVADPNLGERRCTTIGDQNRRFTGHAVRAPVFAASVGIDTCREADVWAVVGRDNGSRCVAVQLCRRRVWLLVARDKGKALEPVGRVRSCAAAADRDWSPVVVVCHRTIGSRSGFVRSSLLSFQPLV